MSNINKKQYSPYFFIFFTTVIVLFAGCKDKTENPDLLYDFANLEMDEVDSGDPLVLQSAIMNQQADCDDCSTLSAANCERGIRLEYRQDINTPWEDAQLEDQEGNIVFQLIRPVPEIQPGTNYLKTEGFVFTTPGIYRYKLDSDVMDVVEERIETNNAANSDSGDVKALNANDRVYELIVRVVDPTGKHLPVPFNKLPIPVKYFKN